MPYHSVDDLPENVTHVLPEHAQAIFKEAFNSAYDEYRDPEDRRDDSLSREDVARRVAWSAVKKTYKKGDDNMWHPKK